jgi:hypothetical protein
VVPRPRLFHFSDDPGIERFEPRPVLVPSERPAGQEWLNGPLVWAITEERQAAYLFPRDCPRVLLWRRPDTTAQDLERWWGGRTCRMIAHVEWAWLDRIRTAVLYRYELPVERCSPMEGGDDWTWLSKETVVPIGRDRIDDLLGALEEQGVELRVMDRLTALRDVWSTSLHASGIRLRHARDWPA